MTAAAIRADTERYPAIRSIARRAAGLGLPADKDYWIETRTAALTAELGLADTEALDERLECEPDPELERRVLEAILIGETLFFRDANCFAALRDRVLPALIETRREQQRLVIWSAACSTGQEPYTLAMLLADSFPEIDDWPVKLLATDISRSHLERAARARYSQFEVNRGLPASALVRHFEQQGDHWQLHDSIRERVELAPFNLCSGDDAPVFGADLVLLRNVLFYFDGAHREATLERVATALRPGGCLVLGAAESLTDETERLERWPEAPCCYRAS